MVWETRNRIACLIGLGTAPLSILHDTAAKYRTANERSWIETCLVSR